MKRDEADRIEKYIFKRTLVSSFLFAVWDDLYASDFYLVLLDSKALIFKAYYQINKKYISITFF